MRPHDKSEHYRGQEKEEYLHAPSRWSLLFATSLLGVVLPIILAVFISRYAVGNWVHPPLHTLISGGGAFAALLLALFILLIQHDEASKSQYVWLAASLASMGVLDSFHASGPPTGISFVLQSLTTLVGGLLLALVLLPKHLLPLSILRLIPCMSVSLCLLLGIFALLFPEQLPIMKIDGQLTLTAKMFNLLGGSGFVVAACFFALYGDALFGERLVLASASFLFATLAFNLPFSLAWSLGWWFWHLLHFFTYFILLWLFLEKYRRYMRSLHEDRKQLEQSRAQLFDLIQKSPSAVTLKDLSGRFILVNRRFEEIFGLKKQDIIGKVTTDVLPCSKREVQNKSDRYSESSIEYEENIYLKGGTKTFLTSCFPLAGDVDHASYVGCIQTDVTASRKMEYQLQLDQKILENAKEAVVITDAEAIIVEINDAYTMITGYEREEAIGKNPRIAQSGRKSVV